MALRRFLFSVEGAPYILVPFVPLAVILELVHADPVLVFFASALGVIPTAALMGRATEGLAERAAPGVGGLLNVTFGDAPGRIVGWVARGAGLREVVKAAVIGSIMGNAWLGLGASAVVGGLGRERQR